MLNMLTFFGHSKPLFVFLLIQWLPQIQCGWQTTKHDPGYCAMRGVCGTGLGKRQDSILNCAQNIPTPPSDPQLLNQIKEICPTIYDPNGRYCCDSDQLNQLQSSIGEAQLLILQCPACNLNFRHFWCSFTCSPDQAQFLSIEKIQTCKNRTGENVTNCVDTVDFFVDPYYGAKFYNSCKDVVFPAANIPAMQFLGGGAKNYSAWFAFLGLQQDVAQRTGSPFQIDFPAIEEMPSDMSPLNSTMYNCWDSGYSCSCGDCPDAPACRPPEVVPKSKKEVGCKIGGATIPHISCTSFAAIIIEVVIVIVAVMLFIFGSNLYKKKDEELRREPLLSQTEKNGMPQDSAEFVLTQTALQLDQVQHPFVSRILRRFFQHMGEFVASQPFLFLACFVILVVLSALGMTFLGSVETDPQVLWVGPHAISAINEKKYNDYFGPFYRIEQFIITDSANKPIINNDTMMLMFEIQAKMDALSVEVESDSGTVNVTLQDICYKPFGSVCATESVLQYWQMDVDSYLKDAAKYAANGGSCVEWCVSHFSTDCFSVFGAPTSPNLVLGGFPEGKGFVSYTDNSTAYVTTYPVDSSQQNLPFALAWESQFIKLLEEVIAPLVKEKGFQISYSSQRSIQDELGRETYADYPTVAFSYLAMFIYLIIALTQWTCSSCKALMVEFRLGLAVAGVLVIALSASLSLALCNAFGMWSSLISLEVIPFFVLAIGSDNMILLFHAMQKVKRVYSQQDVKWQCGRALSEAGPSITMAAISEAVAFFMGALSQMPAVKYYAIQAGIAILFNYVLQVTIFLCAIAWDEKRVRNGRSDLICVKVRPPQPPPPDYQIQETGTPKQSLLHPEQTYQGGVLGYYMTRIHAPLILHPISKLITVIVFSALLMFSVSRLPQMSVGLSQNVALPRDSYLQKYFNDIMEYLRVGPPLYFVVEDIDLNTETSDDMNKICQDDKSFPNSLVNQISLAAQQPATTYIATPSNSWLDGFIGWLNPTYTDCCRFYTGNDTFCPAENEDTVQQCLYTKYSPECSRSPCKFNNYTGRPTVYDSQKYLPWFLEAKPYHCCSNGGLGVYDDSLYQVNGSVAGLENGMVVASNFRTYYTTLSTQHDFINSLRTVRDMVNKMQKELGINIFPYSVFHVFFEQYLHIGESSGLILGLACVCVFVIVLAFTASFWASGILCITLVMMLVDLIGFMQVFNVQLNAVSLVNLAMGLGISVEFVAHIMHEFVESKGSRTERAYASLRNKGASVLTGIAITKFIGVLVLAFASTRIFEIYYFRVYMILVVVGALHGLIFLPVILSIMGPPQLKTIPPIQAEENSN